MATAGTSNTHVSESVVGGRTSPNDRRGGRATCSVGKYMLIFVQVCVYNVCKCVNMG